MERLLGSSCYEGQPISCRTISLQNVSSAEGNTLLRILTTHPFTDEYVVYVAPSPLQLQVLSKILTPKLLQTFTRGATAQCLALSELDVVTEGSTLYLRTLSHLQSPS